MNNSTKHEIYTLRSIAYDLMRRLFIEEPTPELLQFLHREGFLVFPETTPNQDIETIVQKLTAYLDKHNLNAQQEDFELLHWDFTQLFIGPQMPSAPPWESYYVSKDKLLFQETTKSVEALSRKHGFDIDEKEYEAADHIGLELDFMFQLNKLLVNNIKSDQSDLASIQNSFKLQHHFLQEHLLRFCSPFAQKMRDTAQTEFYKQLAFLLEHFLNADEKWLQAQNITDP